MACRRASTWPLLLALPLRVLGDARMGALLLLLCVAAQVLAAGADLRFGLASLAVTLDPRFATDATSARINRLLYRSLVDFNERFEAVPSLATWTNPRPRVFRFKLNADRAPFSDGSALESNDVKATYESILDPSSASPHRGSLAQIETIDVIDRDSVEFVLSRDDPLFAGALSVGIMPAKLIAAKHAFARQPVGSGAFTLQAWPEENQLVLERRRDGLRVEFVRVPESTVRALKIARGEVDMLQGDLPAEIVTWLRGRRDISVHIAPGINVAYLGFNLEDAHTGELRVRQAIAHAIDRAGIVRYLLGGRAKLASSLLVPEHWAGHPGLPTVGYDPERARSMLRAAGYGPSRELSLSYKTSSDPFRLRLGTVIAHQLAAVGINVKLESYDWGTFYADVKAGRFQMYSLAWIGIKNPDIFRYTLHSSSVPPRGANRGRFSDVLVDQLIEQAETAQGTAARAKLYRALQVHLLDRLPVVPLWYESQLFVRRSRVEGYKLSSDGNFDGLIHVKRPTH